MGGVDDEDGCAVDVWQDLFRVDSRMWSRANEALRTASRARAESFGRVLSVSLAL